MSLKYAQFVSVRTTLYKLCVVLAGVCSLSGGCAFSAGHIISLSEDVQS